MQTWHKWAPTGAILVIDECQRVFRPRPSGSKVPDYVAELETHRHRGLDIFLLTQHPRLIDTNVRALVGHHAHIAKTNLGVRKILEWERCGDPTLARDVQAAVKSVYTLDKKAFGVYKSAEEHTKIKTKLSRVVYIFPVVLFVIIAAGWYLYHGMKDKYQEAVTPQTVEQAPPPMQPPEQPPMQTAGGGVSGQYPPAQTAAAPEPPKPHITADDYEPRIAGLPHTAPIYDSHNRQITTMPYPVACVKSANKCTCYTEQATPIKDFDRSLCLDYVKNGIYNPYKQRQTVANEPQKANQPSNGGAMVAALDGKDKLTLAQEAYATAPSAQ